MSRTAADGRRTELAKIHITASQLGLKSKVDDSLYREMLANVGGVSSAADLDAAGRRKVLEHLDSLRREETKAPRYVRGTQAALIRWLWTQLAKAGLVDDKSDRALRRYIAQHASLGTPKEVITERDPRHLDRAEASKVIEQLKQWRERGTT